MIALRGQYGEHAPKWADSYETTAAHIANVCSTAPIDGLDQPHCAAILVDLAWHESRFDPNAEGDVTVSAAERTPHSFGLFQIQAKTIGHEIPRKEWDGGEQVVDVVRLLQTSFAICSKRAPNERLAWYASGGKTCDRALGLSRFRLGEVELLLKKHPFFPLSGPTTAP